MVWKLHPSRMGWHSVMVSHHRDRSGRAWACTRMSGARVTSIGVRRSAAPNSLRTGSQSSGSPCATVVTPTAIGAPRCTSCSGTE